MFVATLLVISVGIRLDAGSAAKRKQYGMVTAIERVKGNWYITIDYVEFLTGKGGERAAIADGDIAPGDGLSDDHYLRNRSRRLRKLRLAPDARIRMWMTASEIKSVTPAELQAALRDAKKGSRTNPSTWYGVGDDGVLCVVQITEGIVSGIEGIYTP